MEEKDLIIRRAQNAVVSRDYALAARLYKTLLKDDAKNVELLKALGNVYIKSGDDEKALLYFEQILTFHPNNFEALNAEGGIYRRLYRYRDAIRVLEKALETGQNNAMVNYTLGFTYKSMGNNSDAIECFESVIEDNPSDVLAYNHLGAIYASQDQYEKSISIYKRGLQIDPNHPILQFNLAKSYEAIHDDTSAISSYETALRAKPGWADAVHAYASLLLKHRKTKVAANIAKNSISLNPQDISLRILEGTILLAQCNYQAAIDAFEQVLKMDSENIEASILLSKAYEKAEKFDGSLKAILKADEFLTKKGEKNIAVEKQLASVLLSTGSLEQAEEKIERLSLEACENGNPNEPEILDLKQQLCICNDDEEGADTFHKKIIATNPSYTKDIAHKGNRYFQLGNLEKAVQAYTEYLESNNKDSSYWVALGRVNEVLGNDIEALDNYSTALAFDPGNQAAENWTKALNHKMIIQDMSPMLSKKDEEAENPLKGAITIETEEVSIDEFGDFNDESENKVEQSEKGSFENSENEEETLESDEIDPKDIQFDENDVDIFDIDNSVTPGEEIFDSDFENSGDEIQNESEEKTEDDEDGIKDALNSMKDQIQDMKDILSEENDDEIDSAFENVNDLPEENPFEQPGVEETNSDEAAALAAEKNGIEKSQRRMEEENECQQKKLEEFNRQIDDKIAEAQKIVEKAEMASEYVQDAANYAERAWMAAQHAADAAQGIPSMEEIVNRVSEEVSENANEMIDEAAKEIKESLELENKKTENQDNDDENISSEISEDILKSENSPSEEIESLNETSEEIEISDEIENNGELETLDENITCAQENSQPLTVESVKGESLKVQTINADCLNTQSFPSSVNFSAESCLPLINKVSEMLPIFGKMLENREEARKFEKEINLFSQLKDLGEFLPEDMRLQFLSGKMRLLLDYLIARLSGKPGLLMMTNSIRKTEVFDNMVNDVSPESEGLSGKKLVKKVLVDMKIMASKLSDQNLAKALINEVLEVEKKL